MNVARDLDAPRIHNRVLTEAQLAEYHENGYVAIRNALSPDLLARLIATTARLYAGLGAVSTMAARRLASKIWRVATGEEPPTKR